MRWRTLAVFLATLALSRVASAQDTPSASDTALAREQYQDGMHFAQTGHWEQAYNAFSRAYGLVHRPALLVNLASAESQTGRLVEAAEHYRTFLREVTSGHEAAQRPAVQSALDALDGRIPRARIVPDDSRPADTYTLDGHSMPSAAIGTPYPIDPGDHVLVVTSDGAEVGRSAFTMRETESRDVSVAVHRPAQVDTRARPDTRHDVPHDTHDLTVHHDDVIAPPPPITHDDGGVLASPVFWVIVGLVVVAGATVGIVFATQGGRDPFDGANLGTTVVPVTRHRLALVLAVGASLVTACRQDPTEVVLVVDTDLALPTEADSVHIVVTGTTGVATYDMQVPVGSGGRTLPLSLTLSHQSGAPLGPVRVSASADHGGTSVVRRDVTTEFVEGKTKLLTVLLLRACAGRMCGTDMTCTASGCAAQHQPGTGLPEFTMLPPRFDAGVLGDGCRPEACNGLDDDCDGVPDDGFDLTSETGNCGACGNDCAGKPGVATAHCAASVCVVDTCVPGRGDCVGGGADGCETDTTTDAMHCGDCTTPCSTTHDTATCSASTCSLTCTTGFDDCDTMASTGCEADLSDAANCGRCFHHCTTACSAGFCDDEVVTQVVTGGQHACALRRSGVVSCWGDNASGQLGDGTTTRRTSPVDARGITNAIAIAAGGQHTCAILADHSVACWGSGANGRLGRGSTTDSSTPVAVTGVSDAIAIAAGLGHTCVVRTGGSMKCWGLGGGGQIGNGVAANALSPTDVMGLVDASGVACGQSHSCAVRTGGGVKCWGLSDHGQIGQLTPFLPSSSTPVDVPNVMGIVAIASSPGANHTCGRDGSGGVTCWGQGTDGELGDETMVDRGSVGTPVTLPMTASAIGVGATYSCAVIADGTAQCWGANANGQLGDGTTLPHIAPAAVMGASSLVELAGGTAHTCARATSGAVTCWGWNSSGQLGDGTMTDRLTPVGVRTLPF